MADQPPEDAHRLPVLRLVQRRPAPHDAEVLPPKHAPPSAYTFLPVGRQLLPLRGVLRGVGHDAAMAAGQLYLSASRQMLGVLGPNHVVPRLGQPRLSDKRHAHDQEMKMWRPATLRFQLPHGAESREFVREAPAQRVEVALPSAPVARPRARVRQGDEEQPAADVRNRHSAQRLLQPSTRAPRELTDTSTAAYGRLRARSDIVAPQLRAGAAAGGRDAAGAHRPEIWTVDKPNARCGALLPLIQPERSSGALGRRSFTMRPASWQGSDPSLSRARGPPLDKAGFSVAARTAYLAAPPLYQGFTNY